MGSTTKVVDTRPKSTQTLGDNLTNYLMGGPGQQASRQAGPQGYSGMGGPTAMPNAMDSFSEPVWHRPMANGGLDLGAGMGQIGPHALGIGQAGGPQPASGFDRMFAQQPAQGPQVANPGNPQMVGPMAGPQQVQATQVGFDPTTVQMLNPSNLPMIGNPLQGIPGDRSAIRNVDTQYAIPGVGTQSVDQLGGANSAFFQNMVNQLQPAFNTQRDLALAQAKESAGNLTGSGFANRLGTAMNRSLGDQQAQLANYATQGLNTEVNRQLGVAGMNNQANIQAAQLGAQGQMANQGADQSFLNFLLNRGQLGQQGALANLDAATRIGLANQGTQTQLAGLGLQAGQANQDALLRAGMANQGAGLTANAQDLARMQGNQGAQQSYDLARGGWQQQANNLGYQTQADIANQNAQRFMQMLLGMGTNNGSGQVVQSGGIGSVLGPLGSIAGTALAGRIAGGK